MVMHVFCALQPRAKYIYYIHVNIYENFLTCLNRVTRAILCYQIAAAAIISIGVIYSIRHQIHQGRQTALYNLCMLHIVHLSMPGHATLYLSTRGGMRYLLFFERYIILSMQESQGYHFIETYSFVFFFQADKSGTRKYSSKYVLRIRETYIQYDSLVRKKK